MEQKPYTFDRVVRIIIALAIITAIVFLINRLSSVLLPFLIGWIIAYLLHPIVKFFQYRCRFKNRALSVAVTLVLFVAVLVGAVWLVVPSLVGEFAKMGHLLIVYAQRFQDSAFVQSGFYTWLVSEFQMVDYQNMLTFDSLQTVLGKVAPHFFNLLSGTWSVLAGMFVVMVVVLYTIFIMLDYEKIADGFIGVVPARFRPFVSELAHDVEEGMNKYFRGQALIALCVGVLFAIAFSILRLPMAISMGLLIGLLNMVPYLQTIGFVPVIFLALLRSMETGQSFWLLLLGIAIVLIVVQGIQDLFLTPKIMGKQLGLKPAIILLSLSVFGSLFGLVGMIIALPTTTLIISYYKRFVLGESRASESIVSEQNMQNVDEKEGKKQE